MCSFCPVIARMDYSFVGPAGADARAATERFGATGRQDGTGVIGRVRNQPEGRVAKRKIGLLSR